MELEELKNICLEELEFKIIYHKYSHFFKVYIYVNGNSNYNKKLTDILNNELKSDSEFFNSDIVIKILDRNNYTTEDLYTYSNKFTNFDDFYKNYSGILEELAFINKYPESHHMLL